MSLGGLIEQRKLVVCVGTGGVGKTTMAAALAFGAAARGRRAMVLTIDPARQLARALGLATLEAGVTHRIPPEVLATSGVAIEGELSFAMLDEKVAWDGFVRRHAPSATVRDAILENPFYQRLSTSFAGTTEYMAVEELCRLDASGRYDLIVLDTPPAAHALDFVRAPARLERLLEPLVVRWLGSMSTVVAEGGVAAWVSKRLERATGGDVLREIAAFFRAIVGLLDAIEARARRARALLRDPRTAFVLVAAPHPEVLAQTAALTDEMARLGTPLAAAILNRVLPVDVSRALDGDAPNELLVALAAAAVPAPVVEHARRSLLSLALRHHAERAARSRLQSSLPQATPMALVAQHQSDSPSLRDVAAMASSLLD